MEFTCRFLYTFATSVTLEFVAHTIAPPGRSNPKSSAPIRSASKPTRADTNSELRTNTDARSTAATTPPKMPAATEVTFVSRMVAFPPSKMKTRPPAPPTFTDFTSEFVSEN